MNNEDVWSHYKRYTADITDLSRRLAFGGAAVCWIFRSADGTFPRSVLWAFLEIFAFFASDMLQSLVGAIGHRRWIRRSEIELFERTGSIDGEYSKPASLDVWPYRLFLWKLVFLALSFLSLGAHILGLLA